MAAKIKLKRIGKKKMPFYRVVIQDESSAPRGEIIDQLGVYNPLLSDAKLDVDKKKALEWISKGAKPTEKVRVLFGKAGILSPVSFEGRVKRKPKVKEGSAETAAPQAAPAQAAPAKPA